MIGLGVFLIALDYLGSANNPGVAFLKQYPNSALPIGIFLVLMYLACFIGLMTGGSMIERWTGVPQSKNGTALGALMGIGERSLSGLLMINLNGRLIVNLDR